MLSPTERFFYDNAGWSYDPKTETSEQGRERAARHLAHAEDLLKRGPFYVTVERDGFPYDGDVPYDGPVWLVSLWSVQDSDRPQHLGCVGGVACESDSPYLRVIAAELAADHLKGE